MLEQTVRRGPATFQCTPCSVPWAATPTVCDVYARRPPYSHHQSRYEYFSGVPSLSWHVERTKLRRFTAVHAVTGALGAIPVAALYMTNVRHPFLGVLSAELRPFAAVYTKLWLSVAISLAAPLVANVNHPALGVLGAELNSFAAVHAICWPLGASYCSVHFLLTTSTIPSLACLWHRTASFCCRSCHSSLSVIGVSGVSPCVLAFCWYDLLPTTMEASLVCLSVVVVRNCVGFVSHVQRFVRGWRYTSCQQQSHAARLHAIAIVQR